MLTREYVVLDEDIEVTVSDRDSMRVHVYKYKKGDKVTLIVDGDDKHLLDFTNGKIVIIDASHLCNYTVGG